jgi:hypothetical protein
MLNFWKENVLLCLVCVLLTAQGIAADPVVSVGVDPGYQTVKTFTIGDNADPGVNIAQYGITATCDPKSLENNEVKPIDASWTCSVKNITPIPNATVNPNIPSVSAPSGGNGNWMVYVSSPNAGEWKIEFEATVTYDVWDKIKDRKKLKDDGITPEKFGQYSGTGTCTFKVTNGKFKIILVPDDNCKETPDNKRSVTYFGLGETGKIKVKPIEPNDTVTVTKISATPENICKAGKYSFTIRQQPGSATITVKAEVTKNGSTTAGTETYGITAIAPTNMYGVSKKDNFNILLVGAGMYVWVGFEPKDVSFSKSKIAEGYTRGSHNDIVLDHIPNNWKAGAGDVMTGSITSRRDQLFFSGFPLNTGVGAITWDIPFGYFNNEGIFISVLTNPQIGNFDGSGGCRITKFGKQATRVPQSVLSLIRAVQTNTPYRYGWKYID